MTHFRPDPSRFSRSALNDRVVARGEVLPAFQAVSPTLLLSLLSLLGLLLLLGNIPGTS
jgi:hypothetical protein